MATTVTDDLTSGVSAHHDDMTSLPSAQSKWPEPTDAATSATDDPEGDDKDQAPKTPDEGEAGADEETKVYEVRWSGHAGHLADYMAKLETDVASADARLATREGTLPVHRIALCIASPFFARILKDISQGECPVVVLKDAPLHLLRLLLSFCYSGCVTIPAQDVADILRLAEELEISGLRVERSTMQQCGLTTALFPSAAPPPDKEPRVLLPEKRSLSPCDLSNKRPKTDPDSSAAAPPRQGPGREKVIPPPLPLEVVQHLVTTPGASSLQSPSPAVSPERSSPPHQGLSLVDTAKLLLPQEQTPATTTSDPVTTASTATISNSSFSGSSSSGGVHRHVFSSASVPSSPTTSTSPRQTPTTPTVLFASLPATPTSIGGEPLTPTTPNSGGSKSGGNSGGSRVLLWRFLLDLLHDPLYSPVYIRWIDRSAGIFRIMESDMVAQLWGITRKNPKMNYEKMSRGMRTYYKRGILFHIDGTKLIYKFNTVDPEIEQRMRYYDLQGQCGGQAAAAAVTAAAVMDSAVGRSLSSVRASGTGRSRCQSLSAAGEGLWSALKGEGKDIPSLQDLGGSSTTSAPSSAHMDAFYSPFLREGSFIYDPYLSFFRANRKELF